MSGLRQVSSSSAPRMDVSIKKEKTDEKCNTGSSIAKDYEEDKKLKIKDEDKKPTIKQEVKQEVIGVAVKKEQEVSRHFIDDEKPARLRPGFLSVPTTPRKRAYIPWLRPRSSSRRTASLTPSVQNKNRDPPSEVISLVSSDDEEDVRVVRVRRTTLSDPFFEQINCEEHDRLPLVGTSTHLRRNRPLRMTLELKVEGQLYGSSSTVEVENEQAIPRDVMSRLERSLLRLLRQKGLNSSSRDNSGPSEGKR